MVVFVNTNDFLTVGLGLMQPWEVLEHKFDHEQNELLLTIGVMSNRTYYPCPKCGEPCIATSRIQEIDFYYSNFLHYQCKIKAKIPSINCKKHEIVQATLSLRTDKWTTLTIFE